MNSITSSFSDGKALPRRQLREKRMGNGRQAPGSIEDKRKILRTGSYFFLQEIKNIKQRKSAQGIFYFYSGQ